ncbi:Cof-type HAD-IIB family hydrolase [Geitlerinema splendidum]|nr:Cof-type HAD-IIB family hydrolase [Geitlerinema splendidum]
MIAIDLDGTLLTHERVPHPANLNSIRQASCAGISICLASGRAFQTMQPFAAQLGNPGPIVSCNGAYVRSESGEVILDVSLPPEAVSLIAKYARELDIHTNTYIGSAIGFSHAGTWAELYEGRTGCHGISMAWKEIEGSRPSKLLFVDQPEKIEIYKSEMQDLLARYQISVISSEPEYVEFLPPGITKQTGVAAAARHLGIDRLEVAAIGDWLNDLEMVEWAGWGAAVANAHPDVKAAADTVVSSNDEGGVSEFIHLVLNQLEKV